METIVQAFFLQQLHIVKIILPYIKSQRVQKKMHDIAKKNKDYQHLLDVMLPMRFCAGRTRTRTYGDESNLMLYIIPFTAKLPLKTQIKDGSRGLADGCLMPCPGGSNYPNNRSPPLSWLTMMGPKVLLIKCFNLWLAVKWKTEWCNQLACLQLMRLTESTVWFEHKQVLES